MSIGGSTYNALEVFIPKSFTEDDGLGPIYAGVRFAVMNSFDALDSPGEYVLKRTGAATSVFDHFLRFSQRCTIPTHINRCRRTPQE